MGNDTLRKEMLLSYVEDVLMPATAEDIAYIQAEGDLDLWLVTMEDGEEYWLLENGNPCGIYKKCGIYSDAAHVLETYQLMKDRDISNIEEDRYSYIKKDQ